MTPYGEWFCEHIATSRADYLLRLLWLAVIEKLNDDKTLFFSIAYLREGWGIHRIRGGEGHRDL